MQLDPDDIEQIANRVAELIEGSASQRGRYVDAATLAAELDVERDWVYAHARQLGAIRLGGPRGRLRFDRERALRALSDNPPLAGVEPTRRPRKGTRHERRGPADLIPYES